MKTTYPGINYGYGLTNRSIETGICYGVISANSISGEALNEFECNYQAFCPHCTSELSDEQIDLVDELNACPICQESIDSTDDLYGDEPSSQTYEQDGYSLEYSADSNNIWVFKSPYIIKAQYCSPCYPGAGNLDTPCDNGPDTYALGLDWFDSEYVPAPYSQEDISEV